MQAQTDIATPAAPADFVKPAPLLTTIARADLPRLGEWIAAFGGIAAAIMPGRRISAEHPDYLLILPEGLAFESLDLPFGGRGHKIAGADHDVDGLANTIALLDSGIDHPAADFCRALCPSGTADFYLPARHELRAAWQTCPELFDDYAYWTSTQGGSNNAWFQYADSGNQNGNNKDWGARCRAVRRLIIQ